MLDSLMALWLFGYVLFSSDCSGFSSSAMTRAEKAKLMVVGTLTLLAGITGGWEGAAAVFLGCAFVLGVWTVISAGVDFLMGPQGPPRGDVTIYWQSDIDPRDGDPTRPEK